MTGDSPGAFEYFQRIESHFLLHRGSPLLLSPSDYRVARAWHEDGVPLDLVLRTMDEFFESRRERAGDDEAPKVWGLRQVRPAVDAAWKRLRELTAPGDRESPDAAPAIDVAGRLAALARALEGSLPDGLPGRRRFGERLAALGSDPGASDPRRVEEGLAAVEDEVLDALLADLEPDGRAALEAEVDRALAPLADRMTREEAASTRDRLLRQKVRRRVGLPTLSLFGPDG